MINLKINYKNNSTELCEIGRKYESDGIYIKECYDNNSDNHVYVDNDLSYHNIINKLKRNKVRR